MYHALSVGVYSGCMYLYKFQVGHECCVYRDFFFIVVGLIPFLQSIRSTTSGAAISRDS